jgi:hypothetical protein
MVCGRCGIHPVRDATPRCGASTIFETSLPAVWWCAINKRTDDRLFWKFAGVDSGTLFEPPDKSLDSHVCVTINALWTYVDVPAMDHENEHPSCIV